jgi:hypothetical protein
VSCLNVSDDGIAALPSFPALEELMPMDVPDAGYRHIGSGLTNARVAPLARLPRLRELRVSGGGVTIEVRAAFPANVEVF